MKVTRVSMRVMGVLELRYGAFLEYVNISQQQHVERVESISKLKSGEKNLQSEWRTVQFFFLQTFGEHFFLIFSLFSESSVEKAGEIHFQN